MVDTDASHKSIGAVLSQRQECVERVIADASRSFDNRERNYCINRRGLLPIVYFLKYFKQCLLGRKFKVNIGHAALIWLRRTPDPISHQARWCQRLQEFDFVGDLRPGTKHGKADVLSRRPCNGKYCACKEPEPPLYLVGQPIGPR